MTKNRTPAVRAFGTKDEAAIFGTKIVAGRCNSERHGSAESVAMTPDPSAARVTARTDGKKSK
jgi:hypothetical protein